MTTISHRRYAGIRNIEVPFPLHSEIIRSTTVGSDPGFLSIVLSVRPTHSFPLALQRSPNSLCTKQTRIGQELEHY